MKKNTEVTRKPGCSPEYLEYLDEKETLKTDFNIKIAAIRKIYEQKLEILAKHFQAKTRSDSAKTIRRFYK